MNRTSRTWDIAAIIVLAASLAFRLATFSQARFAADEALQYGIAKDVADFKLFPTKGTAITGAVKAYIPGGAYYATLALPLLVSDRPEAPMLWIGLLAFGGLVLGWRLLRAEYGSFAGFGAILMAAFNPFPMFHSDRIWNPNLLLPIGYLFLFLLARTVRGQGRRPLFWLAALLVFAPQIHLSCAHIVLLAGLVLLAARPQGLRWQHLLAGAALGAATYLPYLVVDAMQGFENTRALTGNIAKTTAPAIESLRAVYYMVLFAGGDMTYFVAHGAASPMTEWGFWRGDGPARMAAFLGWPRAGGVLPAVGITLGVLASLAATISMLGGTTARLLRRRVEAIREDPLAFTALLNLPLLAFLFWGRKHFYPHYTIVVFPLALVPIAWVLSRVKTDRWAVATTSLLVCVALSQAVLTERHYRTDEARTSVPVYREAAAIILRDNPGGPSAFTCALPGTQCAAYPAHRIADREFGHDFREDRNARVRYTLIPPDERNAVSAVRVWDLGPVWLIRRDRFDTLGPNGR